MSASRPETPISINNQNDLPQIHPQANILGNPTNETALSNESRVHEVDQQGFAGQCF